MHYRLMLGVVIVQRDLCYFHGVDVVAPQLLLNTNAAAILNNLNAQDQCM